eukprot:scaffold127571_cov35-Tisochrysis_lutea.AAC.1
MRACDVRVMYPLQIDCKGADADCGSLKHSEPRPSSIRKSSLLRLWVPLELGESGRENLARICRSNNRDRRASHAHSISGRIRISTMRRATTGHVFKDDLRHQRMLAPMAVMASCMTRDARAY